MTVTDRTKEYLNLLPRPSEPEFEALKRSIASEHGLIVPVILKRLNSSRRTL